MRLIDADALIRRWCGIKCGCERDECGRGIEPCIVVMAIEEAPTIDRPQGEWIKDEDGTYRCSNCGGCEEQYIYGTENWYGCGESKFCPSCGARMKGADDEV